ncbi:hypothetical protein Acr_15g0009250 [Actinidia rufa]|uniref:Uncharacterized protein n=1 Tax=Actinidia rufa TaxID=165716 RepID=A0A7J0FV41_9ERIC|nr:hypothetical protein Acr_15g0009250 [Actinidia rufa]
MTSRVEASYRKYSASTKQRWKWKRKEFTKVKSAYRRWEALSSGSDLESSYLRKVWRKDCPFRIEIFFGLSEKEERRSRNVILGGLPGAHSMLLCPEGGGSEGCVFGGSAMVLVRAPRDLTESGLELLDVTSDWRLVLEHNRDSISTSLIKCGTISTWHPPFIILISSAVASLFGHPIISWSPKVEKETSDHFLIVFSHGRCGLSVWFGRTWNGIAIELVRDIQLGALSTSQQVRTPSEEGVSVCRSLGHLAKLKIQWARKLGDGEDHLIEMTELTSVAISLLSRKLKTWMLGSMPRYKRKSPSYCELEECSDEIMCKVFSATLKGLVRSWFKKLSPRIIDSFGDLSKLFVVNFMSYRVRQKNISHFFMVHQKNGWCRRTSITINCPFAHLPQVPTDATTVGKLLLPSSTPQRSRVPVATGATPEPFHCLLAHQEHPFSAANYNPFPRQPQSRMPPSSNTSTGPPPRQPTHHYLLINLAESPTQVLTPLQVLNQEAMNAQLPPTPPRQQQQPPLEDHNHHMLLQEYLMIQEPPPSWPLPLPSYLWGIMASGDRKAGNQLVSKYNLLAKFAALTYFISPNKAAMKGLAPVAWSKSAIDLSKCTVEVEEGGCGVDKTLKPTTMFVPR